MLEQDIKHWLAEDIGDGANTRPSGFRQVP